jgi:hypothetical protein
MFFALVAVAFAVLWVRSYTHREGVLVPLMNSEGRSFASFRGRIGSEPDPAATQWAWRSESANLHDFDWDEWERTTPRWIVGKNYAVVVPHWFPLAVAGALSVAPWLALRFSVRTMLIATTLVAVVLGLAVWASR